MKYITGAFPSACGKTNLAMLIPTLEGWKVETIGDDIAWMKFGDDGRLYAINPEAGFFGVAPGTARETEPERDGHDRARTRSSPTCAKTDDGDVWWEGMTDEPPAHLDRLEGQRLDARLRRARPRTRTRASRRRRRSARRSRPSGRTRRACRSTRSCSAGAAPTTSRSCVEAFDWEHGVFLGATMGSETTAAAAGTVGELRLDPFAMLAVLRLQHGRLLRALARDRPSATARSCRKIFHVNWFRKDDDGKFLWPGFGENSRVLAWIFRRCDGEARGRRDADRPACRPRSARPRRASTSARSGCTRC